MHPLCQRSKQRMKSIRKETSFTAKTGSEYVKRGSKITTEYIHNLLKLRSSGIREMTADRKAADSLSLSCENIWLINEKA